MNTTAACHPVQEFFTISRPVLEAFLRASKSYYGSPGPGRERPHARDCQCDVCEARQWAEGVLTVKKSMAPDAANDISVHGYDARRPARAVDEVTIPRWAAESATTTTPHLCSVCLGLSPSWDGHSKNPPCIGAAREAIQEALDGRRE